MNAIGFVKKFGVEESAKIANESVEFGKNVFYDLSDELYYGSNFGGRICVNDLKQIVDAFELVEAWGGIDKTKDRIDWAIVNKNFYAADMMKHAINLVEQCS